MSFTACGGDNHESVDAGSQLCGGFAGAKCDASHYCSYQFSTCGTGDGAGTCLPLPSSCSASPAVCGCDGMTYASACAAQEAGVSTTQDASRCH